MRLSALAVASLCACTSSSRPEESAPPIQKVAMKREMPSEKKAEKPAPPSVVAADPIAASPKVAPDSALLKALGTSGGASKFSPATADALKGGGRMNGIGAMGNAGGLVGGGAIGSVGGLGGMGTRGFVGGLAGKGSGAGFGVALASPGDGVDSTESYGDYGVNGWTLAEKDHLSTFAADVDTASYTVARRKLLSGSLPPTESVRVEEFVNYFRYSYPQPVDGALGVTMEAAPSPFSAGKHLLRVGVQGKRLTMSERKPAHLTFLVDVSGSMQSADKLPLAQRALRLLVDSLHDGDTVALVTYAGAVRLVLPHTGMEKKAQIHEAIASLTAGGSTAMASGIELAYQQATKVLDGQSLSRVVILSDGDANVGPTGPAAILKLIAGHVKEGVTVTTVGFGMGNYKDDVMEQFANKGNGNHYYVDSLFEAKRIFQTELGGTLEVIAQDVKLQVDFDPAQVKRYRLIGYENRDIADRDFRNDKVDAGEIGSGHTVTAMYEVELQPGAGDQLCTVRVRAKKPRGTEAAEAAFPFKASMLVNRFDGASDDFRFTTSVVGAAELFRQSEHARGWNLDAMLEIARSARGTAADRAEFVSLLEKARPVLKAVAVR